MDLSVNRYSSKARKVSTTCDTCGHAIPINMQQSAEDRLDQLNIRVSTSGSRYNCVTCIEALLRG